MVLSAKLGERVYEFEESSGLSKARSIFMEAAFNTQEEFEELLDKEKIQFTVDLFT